MIKKILSAALSLVLLWGITAAAVPADVVGTPYQRAADLTTSLGIMELQSDGAFNPEGGLTRGEFVKSIVKMLGVAEVPAGDVTFSDVSSGDSLAGYISAAYYLEIATGYSDGSFGVNDPVKLEQAVKMLVAALGRNMEAQTKGGYPTGYFTVASQIGLLKGLKASGGDELNRGQGAVLIYNALEVDLMRQLSYGGENTYSVINGKTVLTERHEIEKGRGRVTANAITKLTSPDSNLKKDEVEIDGEIYKVGDTDAVEFLGYKVDYYYKEDAGIKTLLAILPQRGTGDDFVVAAENIIQLNDSYYLEYMKSPDDRGPIQRVKVSPSADWIFNGRSIQSGYRDYLRDNKIKNGSVRLVDTDSDRTYDLVFVETYVDYIVASVSTTEFIISDLYNNPPIKLVDPEGEKDIFYSIVDTEGAEVPFEEIEEGSVLSIAADSFIQGRTKDGYIYNEIDTENSILYKIIVCTNSIDGTISEINSDGDVLIEDTYYEIGESYKRALDQDLPGLPKVALGAEGTFLIDAFGHIAGADVEAIPGEEYGYLFQIGSSEGISTTVMFKILTRDNEIATFEAADRVKVNDVYIRKENLLTTNYPSARAFEVPSPIYEDGKTVEQLVRYTLNEEGYLTEIYTAVDNAIDTPEGKEPYAGYDLTRFSRDFASNGTGDKSILRNQKTNIGLKFYLKTSTPLLIVPQFAEKQPEDYLFDTVDYLRNDTRYTLALYDVSEEYEASIAVLYLNPEIREIIPGSIQNSPIGIVERVANVVTEDGNDTVKVYLTMNGQAEQEVIAADLDVSNHEAAADYGEGATTSTWGTKLISVTELKKGDIIQVRKNAYGEMTFFRLLFRANSSEPLPPYRERFNTNDQIGGEKPNTDTMYSNIVKSIYAGYGKVVKVRGGSFIFNVRNQEGFEDGKDVVRNCDMFLRFGGAKIYEYNRRTDSIAIVDSSSVTAGQSIFMRLNGVNVRDIVIIKE